jgi:hypothetical protein
MTNTAFYDFFMSTAFYILDTRWKLQATILVMFVILLPLNVSVLKP